MVCSHGVVSCSSALLSVLLLVLIVTMTTGQVLNNEEPCMTKGGFCVESDACSEDQRVNETNLCPEQEQYGAVCCNRGGCRSEGQSTYCNTHRGQILRNEKPCLSEGGICVESNSCTEENRVKKPELCPEQEQYGAVCCNRGPMQVQNQTAKTCMKVQISHETNPRPLAESNFKFGPVIDMKRINGHFLTESVGNESPQIVPANVDCQQHGGRCGQEEECRNVQDFGQLDCNDGSRCCLLIF